MKYRIIGPSDINRRRPRMSYEQFLKWDGENQHVEWVDGRVVPLPGVTGEHNLTGIFLICLFGWFLEGGRRGRLLYRPFQMKTGPDLPGRAPDLIILKQRSLRRLHEYYLEGPADIVVEIMDAASRRLDGVEKFGEYERGGVGEYWLIDPHRQRAEFHCRCQDGRFHPILLGPDGVFRSRTFAGLWLKVDWLWRRPPMTQVSKEWGVP